MLLSTLLGLDPPEQTAARLVATAELFGIAERLGAVEWPVVRAMAPGIVAGSLCAALVDEAISLDADLMLLGLPYRTRLGGDFAIGRTIPYILQNAPSAVWVLRDPINEETR